MEIDHLIQHYQEIIKCYEENQKTEAKDFNVFDFMSEIFGLGETKHSRIIAFYLILMHHMGRVNCFSICFWKG